MRTPRGGRRTVPSRIPSPGTRGVPSLTIHLPRLDAYHLGALLYFFERACGVSGYLLGVNPFDQPGVEAYKVNMFGLLGKPAFAAKTEALQKRVGGADPAFRIAFSDDRW